MKSVDAAGLASSIAWRLHPTDKVEVDEIRVLEGKYVCVSHKSRTRVTSYIRVGVPEVGDDPRMDYAAAIRTTLQQQRLRGLFEGLRRAEVPFLYTVLMTKKEAGEKESPAFEYDLVCGTWADGKEREMETLVDQSEQRAGVLAATLGVALPDASVQRLLRHDLTEFLHSLLLPGGSTFPQLGTPATGSVLCSFQQQSPLVGVAERVPDFYVPNSAESGRDGILLGQIRSQGSDLHDFRLQLDDLRRHVAVLGMTGSGKSTTAKRIVEQVVSSGLPVMVFDWHNEYAEAISETGGKVVAPGKDEFSVNPIEPGPGTDPTEHIALVSDIFSDIYHFTHPQAYMFRNALQKRMSETPPEEVPSLSSLVRTIEAYPLRSAYDNETKVALLRRLVPLTQGQAGKALGSAGSIGIDELLTTSVCVELGHLRDIQSRAVFTDVMLKLVYEEKIRTKSNLDHFTVVEEARNIAPARRQEDPPSVGERMASELRKFGEGMMFVAQFPSQVASEIIKNSGTRIIHRVAWPDDVSIIGDSMGINQKQKEYMTKLKVGEAIVGVARIQRAMLIQVRGNLSQTERSDDNRAAEP